MALIVVATMADLIASLALKRRSCSFSRVTSIMQPTKVPASARRSSSRYQRYPRSRVRKRYSWVSVFSSRSLPRSAR